MSARTIIVTVALVLPLAATAGATAAPAAQRFVIVPAESLVTYRVNETLFREGNRLNVAVGTTNAIKGEIVVDRAAPRSSRIGTITVDISTFRSDSARRDQAIRERWLESSRFPMAEFRPASVQGLPAAYREGEALRLKVVGDLTIRDVTRPTTFDLALALQGSTLRGTAQTTVRMTDFGVDAPSILGILRVENDIHLEFRFTARPPAP